MKEIGIYIHIPFCKQKCYYCDFVSYSDKQAMIEKYIQSLKKEIKYCKQKNEKVKTIYIGGGTPSVINANYIKEILNLINKQFNVLPCAEVTIEVNPGTVTEEKLKKYKEAGVNRLSIGMQSNNDSILKKIGRIHTYKEFEDTYILARKLGFNNINIDVMIGLPSQNKDNVDIIKVIEKLKPEHISVYSLILEEGTKLYTLVKEKKEILPQEDEERQMYWFLKKELETRGYCHYEISNFAKKGYESQHNVDCWSQKEYIGFGVAAHSYYNDTRFSNIEDIEEYIRNIENEEIEKNKMIHEIQSQEDKRKEYMLLGLRKINGINILEFEKCFKKSPNILFEKELSKLKKQNLIDISKDTIKLTNLGLDLANVVWQEFV